MLKIIDENHEYLRDMKLEQSFEQAIFRGKRRPDQSISGFLASKKAAFSELKRQGLDLLETKAGNHLLGHQTSDPQTGSVTEDQRQRIRVLTDGSIDYQKVESAIRKISSDSLEHPAKGSGRATYWGEWLKVKKRIQMMAETAGWIQPLAWCTTRRRMCSRTSSSWMGRPTWCWRTRCLR